jgi:H+/gluconate symporter and related permeases
MIKQGTGNIKIVTTHIHQEEFIMSDFVASPERLITGALLGFAVLLFLIIKVKVQPFIAIMSSALIIGLVAGMPFDMITDTLAEGVGTTLQTIAILIGLGFMFGAILQVSGGVEVIADTLLKVFGEKKLRGHLESLV